MTTFNQLIKKSRKRKIKKNKGASKYLLGCPQKRAVCVKVTTASPKKPNSAKRPIAIVRMMKTKKLITAYIPGIGHNLQEHSYVLLRGGKTQDLPNGVNLKVIRNKYDCAPVQNRKSSRSKYGVKLK